jgi:hypothetical protein
MTLKTPIEKGAILAAFFLHPMDGKILKNNQ